MKYFKIIITILFIILICITVAFHIFSKPKTSKKVLKIIGDDYLVGYKEFKGLKYRYLAPINFDENKPTLLFIHGAIGSLLDFKSLIIDSEMKEKYNIFSFDRSNYGDLYNEDYIHKIPFEAELTMNLLDEYSSTSENIIVGYSYGGPIAILAQFDDRITKTILVAPAVDSENEIMPFLLWFYKNKYTRFLVPLVWQEASKEKIEHIQDLKKIEPFWKLIKKPIIHIQGLSDSLISYLATTNFLKKNIDEDLYTHIAVEGKGHGFVFSEKKYLWIYF